MSVDFDWAGSLHLAQALRSLSDELTVLSSSRARLATTALTQWAGSYGEAFVTRVDDELRTSGLLAAQLRLEAEGWAEEWRKAMDQENWDRYHDAVKRVERKRSNLDKVIGWATGHDDLPNTPAPADRPRPPHFSATRRFADYARH